MPDTPPAPQAQQMWNRPSPGQPQYPVPGPAPASPPLTAAGPLHDTDTIAVTRNGVAVPVPLKVLVAYVASAIAASKGAHS